MLKWTGQGGGVDSSHPSAGSEVDAVQPASANAAASSHWPYVEPLGVVDVQPPLPKPVEVLDETECRELKGQ